MDTPSTTVTTGADIDLRLRAEREKAIARIISLCVLPEEDVKQVAVLLIDGIIMATIRRDLEQLSLATLNVSNLIADISSVGVVGA